MLSAHCTNALPGSLVRQPCRNITSLLTGRRPAELQALKTAVMKHCILLTGSLLQAFSAINKILSLSLCTN
jgi:hypothetical protein